MKSEAEDLGLPIRIVELVGLPGTGKSTIARHLATILSGAGIQTSLKSVLLEDDGNFIQRQQKRFQLILRNAKNCRDLYRRSFRLISDSGQRSTLDFAIVASNFWSVVALLAEGRTAKDRLMIVDQGLVQAVWSVQLSSLRALSLESWAPLLFTAGIAETLLAHIETDISVSRHRVSARNETRTRLESGSSDEQNRQWQVASDNMSTLVEWAQRTMPHDQYGPRVLSIRNHEGTPETAATEIASAYFKRDMLRACAARAQQSQERANEDRLPDHANGQHRGGANPRTGSLNMAETKRT